MPKKRRATETASKGSTTPLCYTPGARVSQPPHAGSQPLQPAYQSHPPQPCPHATAQHTGAAPRQPHTIERQRGERKRASELQIRYQNTKETLHAHCFKAGTRHSACPHRLRLVPSSRWARRRGRRQSHVDKVSQHARIRRTQLLPRVRLDRKVDLFRPGLRVRLGGAGAGFGLGLGQPWTGHRAACSSAAAACGFWPG